jgi:hypothetical protein
MNTKNLLNDLLSTDLTDLKSHTVFSFKNTMEITISSKEICDPSTQKYNPIINDDIFQQIKNHGNGELLKIKKTEIDHLEEVQQIFLDSLYHTDYEKTQIQESNIWSLSSAISRINDEIAYIQIQFYN